MASTSVGTSITEALGAANGGIAKGVGGGKNYIPDEVWRLHKETHFDATILRHFEPMRYGAHM